VKSCKLLLLKDMLPTVETMCGLLQCPFIVADAEPIWQKQNRRVFRIDLPDFHARVLDETAALRGTSTDVLLHTWLEQLAQEVAADPVEAARSGISEKCSTIARWEAAGYAVGDPATSSLVKRLAKG
jgi:hypothetical protein